MRNPVFLSLLSGGLLLVGCASTPPKIAQEKTYVAEGVTLVFGGKYDVEHNQLELTVNGDPIMRGSFPPYTPKQNLNAKYQGLRVSGDCYFGSVLSSEGGVFGKVAGAIQSAKSKSADKCDMFVNGKSVESLYF
ncbi:MAG: hypothetical protein P8045_03120 [Candidatus Thiodiazotropha sp.]|jgi:hypothetical protein